MRQNPWLIAASLGAFLSAATAQAMHAGEAPTPAAAIRIDADGIMRWRDSGEEIRLFGANYCAYSGSDYRVGQRLGADHRAMIRADLAHFVRMGWDGIRICSWADWESADEQGNLLKTPQADLMDYAIAEAGRRGIKMLFTPIHTYNPFWPDQMEKSGSLPGFSRKYDRAVLGRDDAAIAAQANFISQSLEHVNAYSGIALKNDPNIIFVEMINEPVHHPDDDALSVRYINTLTDAVRRTGSTQITFHNYTQDPRIGSAISRSAVDGASFGWYPTGLVSGQTLQGNFLPSVEAYPAMLAAELEGRPRIVYEFDQADALTGYMYPAIARTFRSVGAQFAAIFAYDMLESAPYNLGWQTHYINLVHTPKKAMSAVIAAEVMRRVPAYQAFEPYPDNLTFGDFRISAADDMSELNAADAFIHAGDTTTRPKSPAKLTRLAGFGSSPVVDYEGSGNWFLDQVSAGVWRLEVYPDSVHVAEPFAQQAPGRVVSRLYFRSWPMRIDLPDLGPGFTAQPLNVPQGKNATQTARRGTFAVEPGVWLLTRKGTRATLPTTVAGLGLDEYHVNAPSAYPPTLLNLSAERFVAGGPLRLRFRLATDALPANLAVHVRGDGASWGKDYVAQRARGDVYEADLPPAAFAEGLYRVVVTLDDGAQPLTFPGAVAGRPGVWPYAMDEAFAFRVVSATAPLSLFRAETDVARLHFVRPNEGFRSPAFSVVPGTDDAGAAIRLSVPDLGSATPEHYAASFFVGDRIAARQGARFAPASLSVTLRAPDATAMPLDIFLIEADGSSWQASMFATADWATARVRLADMTFSRSILIPSPFPGLWNYWRNGPAARAGTMPDWAAIERVELRVYPPQGQGPGTSAPRAVDIAQITLGP